MLPERYDPFLVALSYVVAVFGSFTALTIAARLTGRDGQPRIPWLIGATFAQGTGIWSMHFTGMLAFRLPVPIAYDVLLVALSFVVACAGSLVAVLLTYRRRLTRPQLIAGGSAIGAGIAGLHFTAMAAMRLPADMHYSASLVILSVAIAAVVGLVSLWFGRRYQLDGPPRRIASGQVLSALIMGTAITGQHYTAMAATLFSPGPPARIEPGRQVLPGHDLPEVVLLSTFMILGATLASASVDRQARARAMISQRLLAAQEGERRRIARGLHEDLGQLLTAIRLNLQRLTPRDDTAAAIADSLALADEALARVRAISVELRPTVLDDLGLAAAVAWYAARHAERTGYALEIEEGLGPTRLPEHVETVSFRILQQALTNIGRHARATRVHIALRRADTTFELIVRDNGIGFDVAAARVRALAGESLGVLDMAELATLAGGELRIMSAPGSGSTVRARFTVSDS
jgi:NO-binding membrane sensor protein with MHYT domain/two-component sensor histidine kinase